LSILVDVQLEVRHVAFDGQRPVPVFRGMRGEAHQFAFALLEQQGFSHCIHSSFLSDRSP
jgi:hypothetical protein